MLIPNEKAPDFALEGDDSSVHRLSDFRGKSVVLYFYPKDMTPGCTTETCEFDQAMSQIRAHDATVIGISKDSLASHVSFKSKYSLSLLLLSDPDLAIHKQYGAYGPKTMYGKTSLGVIRSTFLIDREGLIVKAWYKVRVKNHVQVVLDTLAKY